MKVNIKAKCVDETKNTFNKTIVITVLTLEEGAEI